MIKKVVITSIGMRFYRSNGWSEKDLKPYLNGSMLLLGHGDNESEDQYFLLNTGSSLDVEAMFEDGLVGEVLGKDSWRETRGLSDIDAMKCRNLQATSLM